MNSGVLRFLEGLKQVNQTVNTFVWVTLGLVLLVGTGLLLTWKTNCFQVRFFRHWMKNTVGSIFRQDVSGHTGEKTVISQFQALCTALAATIGVGNIAGVAAAIVSGGAGAVFWMWVAAFLGMATNFSENILGIYFRRKNAAGEWSGGAMYYLRDGLGRKKGCGLIGRVLAGLFALFTILASFGIGNAGQVNKIVANLEAAFPIPALSGIAIGAATWYGVLIGSLLLVITGIILLGGLNRIASFAERVVPFMVVFFLFGSLVVIFSHISQIGAAFAAIFRTAFVPRAVWGGAAGYTFKTVVTWGLKRGLFSNEAGLGSSVMVHSNSNVREPVRQGMWGIFEVFSTMMICTMTALVVLTSGVVNLETGALAAGTRGDATLVASAFDKTFQIGTMPIGSMFVAFAILLFAFTTILGWSHYGVKAWEYLFGTKATGLYKVLFTLMVLSGALISSSLAWDISDTFNGLMMIPNLIGVISLSGLVCKITNNYLDRKIRHKKIPPLLSAFPEIQKEQQARGEKER